MQVVVMGIGAIGGLLAARLAENKIDVTAVTKHADLAKRIKDLKFILKKISNKFLWKLFPL
jgi:ketopantoate reductase